MTSPAKWNGSWNSELPADWDLYPDAPDFVVLEDPDGNRFCVVDDAPRARTARRQCQKASSLAFSLVSAAERP